MDNRMTPAAGRRYKAFISYRHRPLDSEYAGKLHKRIERYEVPKDLRKDEEKKQKKLGLVFRDLEELPIADDLDENIRIALDNSEYLIVICSPDTPGSVWVQREIEYFLKHHERKNVLACLVAGTPEESFPPQLTQIRDESGNLVDTVEPLAANIVADTAQKRNRLFRTESLRLLASLIGCPYDALYRREQRYRTQRMVTAFAVLAAVAAAFIGLLLNRNARIRDQLMETKRNESEMLAYISQIDMQNGNYRGALEDALNALPGRDPGRPYVASAEEALVNALYLYRHGLNMRYIQSFDQDTQISTLALSPDQSVLATGDAYGKINLYDMASGKLLWSAQHTKEPKSLTFLGEDRLLVRTSGYDHVCLSTEDGAALWHNQEAVIVEVSSETGRCLCTAYASDGRYPFWVIDAATGEKVLDYGPFDHKYTMPKEAAFSPDGKNVAILFPYAEEKRADLWVFGLPGAGGQNSAGGAETTGGQDAEEGASTAGGQNSAGGTETAGAQTAAQGRLIDEGLCFYNTTTDYTLRFGRSGDLALAACGDQEILRGQEGWDTPFLKLYEAEQDWNCRFRTGLDFGTSLRAVQGLVDTSDYMDYMEFGSEGIAMASKTRLVMADPATGAIRFSKDLPDFVTGGHMYENDDMCLALANGLVTWCSSVNGTLGYDVTAGFFKCDFAVDAADSGGGHFTDGITAVVSWGEKRRVTCIGLCGEEGLTPFPFADAVPEGARIHYSPSGKILASVQSDYDNGIYRIALLDPSGSEAPKVMEGEDRYLLNNEQAHIFVTESGKVIMGGKVYDPAEGTETLLTPGLGEITSAFWMTDASCKRAGNAGILTASVDRDAEGNYVLLLWEDGVQTASKTLPLQPGQSGDDRKFDYCGCCAVSGKAAVVCAQEEYEGPKKFAVYLIGEDRWVDAAFLEPERDEVLALGEEHEWLAVQRASGELSIVDVSGGGSGAGVVGSGGADAGAGSGGGAADAGSDVGGASEILTMEAGIPGESVTKMIFADRDQYLLVLTKAGELAVFDTKDGKMLHRSSYSGSNIRFDADARYDVYILPEKQRMLVICDDTTYTEPFCISIDLASFEGNGLYHSVSGYLPLAEQLVSDTYTEELGLYPLYSIEQMQQMAEEQLESKGQSP